MSCLFSCKKKNFILTSIHGQQIELNDSIADMDSITNFVAPYRDRINEILDSTLAYAPRVISREDGKYNTTEGNLMADIIMSEANPIFKSRTSNEIDFVLLNYGGIRSIISKGNVSARTAYQVMPFENSIVIAELTGKSVRELVYFLTNSGVPHPISGLQIILDKNNNLQSVNIKGEPFNEDRTYFVATSSYLLTGGDKMSFFKDNVGVTDVDYMIRNAMIDYFKKIDTIAPVVDDRFIKL
ncbi:2',3'-cyclic-nucleotide 2'-phosphodiesterase (5'-nucleotidase family) [Saonia flava]|uniref:2',3'-cyclic-nucleotide 2'-phosphodiesterase (5'-nucleotidase family) n=1 Tax=Saonia flava TaxID=523696 RepID=A0A846QN79_9FLAO|nr:5'-nucleotidase [Saonia flava]NJB69551.1 2',3'-cyclic-nucleotide 2'-phosphodiesterase (5'-nucleotidase family) [Saonia flava]